MLNQDKENFPNEAQQTDDRTDSLPEETRDLQCCPDFLVSDYVVV